jgi:putative acetyltransferase
MSASVNANDPELRRATNRDASVIWAHISGILGSFGITADLDTTDADLKDIDRFYNCCGAFYTLWEKDRLIGTAAFRLTAEGHAEIGRMYLVAECRGKGLGAFLLNRLLEDAKRKGATQLTLKTASVLTDAIHLYEKFGFQTQRCEASGNCDVLMTMAVGPH